MERDYKLSARIKAAMKAAGFATAKEFCEKFNVPYLTFAQHSQGRRHPTPEFLKLYIQAFGVNKEWLESGEGKPVSSQKQAKNKEIEAEFEAEFEDMINKIQRNIILDSKLLTKILEEVIKLKVKYELSEKKCADITTNLYTQIIKSSNEKVLQKNMLSTFIKTYESTLKRPTRLY